MLTIFVDHDNKEELSVILLPYSHLIALFTAGFAFAFSVSLLWIFCVECRVSAKSSEYKTDANQRRCGGIISNRRTTGERLHLSCI